MVRFVHNLTGLLHNEEVQMPYCLSMSCQIPAWFCSQHGQVGAHTVNLCTRKLLVWVPGSVFTVLVLMKFRKLSPVLLSWILHQT